MIDVMAEYKNDKTGVLTSCTITCEQDDLVILAAAELGRQIGVIMRGGVKSIIPEQWHKENNGKSIPFGFLKPRVKGFAQIAKAAKLNLLLDLHKQGITIADELIPADLLEAFKALTTE